jgi:hypothetical protein
VEGGVRLESIDEALVAFEGDGWIIVDVADAAIAVVAQVLSIENP